GGGAAFFAAFGKSLSQRGSLPVLRRFLHVSTVIWTSKPSAQTSSVGKPSPRPTAALSSAAGTGPIVKPRWVKNHRSAMAAPVTAPGPTGGRSRRRRQRGGNDRRGIGPRSAPHRCAR